MKTDHFEQTMFCIPSYQRDERQDTLKYLRSVGVDKSQIYIFVQTKSDHEKYQKYSADCNVIYRHADNLPKARNNILNEFVANKNVVMLDDDISILATGAKGERFRNIDSNNAFVMVINGMFEYVAKTGCAMWGFYPVPNEFFMSDTIDTQKPVNTILGFPGGFTARFDERFIAKEDIELCGRIIYSGKGIVRCNNIAFRAKHRTNKGGANDIWKSGINAQYSQMLQDMYPGLYEVQRNNPEEIRTVNKGGRRKINKWMI